MRLVPHPLLELVPDRDDQLLLRVPVFDVSLPCTRLQASLLAMFDGGARIDELVEREPRARSARVFLEACARRGVLVPVDDRGGVAFPDVVDVSPRFLQAPPLDAVRAPHFAVVGVPWDRDVSGVPGARFGPAAIRAASSASRFAVAPLTGRPLGFFDHAAQRQVLEGVVFADAGDVLVLPGEDADVVHARVTDVVRRVVDAGARPVVLGGDHSVSFDALAALGGLGRPVCVIHLDAHTDLGDAVPAGSPRPHGRRHLLHHGNVMSVVMADLPWVTRLVQAGLRGVVGAHQRGAADDRVISVGIDDLDDAMTSGRLRAAVPEGAACWLSIDIDVVDPAFAPSTGTPVPGGLLPRELLRLIRHVVAGRDFVGMDVVEVAAPLGPADGTAGIAVACALAFCRAIVER